MKVYVNNHEIADEQIRREMDRMRQGYENYFREMEPGEREKQLQDWAAENLIEQVLLRQEAQSRDIHISDDDVDSALKKVGDPGALDDADAMRRDIKADLQVQKLVSEIEEAVPEPDEDEMLAYYQEHRQEYKIPQLVHASHIVRHIHRPEDRTPVQIKMMEAYTALSEGREFFDVAREYTECSLDEVDLGYFPRGQMVQEFEDVVFALKENEFSQVFETQLGYHIAYLHEKREASLAEFNQVRDRIREELIQSKRTTALEDFVDSLKDSADIRKERESE